MDKKFTKIQLRRIRYTLEDIFNKDQILRLLLAEEDISAVVDSKNLWKLQTLIDEGNLKEVKRIIYKFGWLGTSQVGEIANNALFLVIQHSNLETMEKYLPLLQESMSKGESKLSHYETLVDTIENLKNGKQR